jgi:hypothetical protein
LEYIKVIPFSHAIIDEDGEIVRKFRWSLKEAKWHKDQGKNVIKLEVEKPKPFNTNDYEEAPF